ncbi:PREDICTED: tctex1 domain-containing protein 1-like [Nanorana parkeri]|uniref:tctex1 domain-containing protein 1-like n=1 Tax=Nanorana parkeri TaxID=125878 RepID=UPI000854B574|nr:PREDICTED: tctex1 domain-containing protein 1-like [Nanorana parkeri]
MEATHENEIRRLICPKPKQRQKKNESDGMRSLSETPMLLGSQRFQDQGLRRKAVSQDNIKVRSHSRPNAMESKPNDPDLELHPQPSRCFSAEEALRVIKSILDAELKDCAYDATTSQHRAMELAELVKTAVRDLGYERYKLVCFVVMGPVSQGTIYCCSRSLWSPNSDTSAEYLFQNHSLFALCVVYAGYYE